MHDHTVKADRETKCGFCGKPIHVGDEIGFGEIKNRGLINTVPICLSCFDTRARDLAGRKYDA